MSSSKSAAAQASHHIDYGQQAVKQFVQQLNSCVHPLDVLKFGVEQQNYESLWNQLLNQDLATVYLTVLLGKLVLSENKLIQLMSSSPQQQQQQIDENADAVNSSYNEELPQLQEVVDQLRLSAAKFDPNHPLLLSRRKSLKTRLRKSIIDVDDSCLTVSSPVPAVPIISTLPEKRFLSQDHILERSTIINSIIFVSLFYRFDYQNCSLLNLIDTWTKLRNQVQAQQGNLKNDSIADEARESLCPPQEAIYKYITSCTDYDLTEESDISLPLPFNKFDPLTMVSAYVYSRLQTVCRIPKYSDQIIEESMTLINLIISSKQDLLKLRNILYFLKLLIPQMHLESDEKLKTLTKVLQPFFMEALPLGGLIRDVLIMCKREINYRGTTMRQRLETTINRIRFKDTLVEQRRVVNILFNPCSQYAQHFTDKFDIHAVLSEDEIEFAKANLMLNMFEEAEKKPSDDIGKAIPMEVLAKFYRDGVNLFKKAEQEENRSNLAAGFAKIRQDMVKAANLSVSQRFVTQRTKSPKIPEIGFKFITLPNEEDLLLGERVKRVYPCSASYGIIKELIEKAKEEKPDDEKTTTVDIAIAGGSGTVQHVAHSIYMIQKLDGKILEGVNMRVYLIPLGENNYLSNWLEKYDGWYSRHLHYPCLSPIPIVPFLKSDNTKSMALTTTGSRRSTMITGKRATTVIQRSKSVFGSPIKSYSKKDPVKVGQYKAPKKFLTPHKVLRTLLSDYFVDATNAMPVHIYSLQCLTNEVIEQQQGAQMQKTKSRKVVDMLSLSFCQRMEIGFFAEAITFQKAEKLEGATFDEIQANKNFKFTGMQAVLSYVPMDPTGEVNRTAEINEPPKTYNVISIRSCSMASDRGEMVAPCQPWLEVFTEEVNTGKDKKKKSANVVNTSYHVASLSIESNTIDKFAVVLDGEIYGSYHRIVINLSSNTMNLMTFTEPILF